MNDCFFWNIYIPINSMERLDKNFYKKLQEYKSCVAAKIKEKDKTFFKSDIFYKLREELNLAYEKCTDLSNVSKNNDGEYPYPPCDFKSITQTVDGKSKTINYVCIATPKYDLVKKIEAGKFFNLSPFYSVGEQTEDIKKKDDFSKVYLNSTVKDIISVAREHTDTLKKHSPYNYCIEMLEWICKYPSNSLSIINFNYIYSKEDINYALDEFKNKALIVS